MKRCFISHHKRRLQCIKNTTWIMNQINYKLNKVEDILDNLPSMVIFL